MKTTVNHRLTFGEAETLSGLVQDTIDAIERVRVQGVTDTMAVASFLGVGGVGMDEITEKEFFEAVGMKLTDLKNVREKLRSIYGI